MRYFLKLRYCIFLLSFFAKAQNSSNYEVIKNIPYYPESMRSSDNYIKEQCVLDIYKPIGKTNAPIIVWFHGGGLTGGTKNIPKELLDYGNLIGIDAIFCQPFIF